MSKNTGTNRPKHYWSAEQDALLVALYPFSRAETIAKFLKLRVEQIYARVHKIHVSKSQWFKDSPLSSKLTNGALGTSSRFTKGHIPANKGIKGVSFPGTEATQFKPGSRSLNWLPVGSTRVCGKDGYILMKMAEGINQYRPIHRIIWARMHGPVPTGHVVIFVDRNKLNISIINLSLITNAENCKRNSFHNYGKEIAKAYQLKGQITRQINKRRKAQREQPNQ